LESQWYIDRGSPQSTDSQPTEPQQRAAWLSAIIANTPATVYIDSLGRTFLSVQHNRTFKIDDVTKKATNITEGFYKTITELDIENNVRKITDARGNARNAIQIRYARQSTVFIKYRCRRTMDGK
jgi:hypothetical protein